MATAKNDKSERTRKAAEALAEQQRRETLRRRLNIGGVVAIVIAIVVVGFVVSQARQTTTDVSAPAAGASDYGLTIGEADAPHTIVIYEDFLCPFCRELESKTNTQLAALVEQGSVLVDYRPFQLLGPDYSKQAASAFKVVLDASGPEVAKAFHDELYADQPDEGGPYPDSDWLVEKAVDAGAEESAVRPGIEDEAQLDWVKAASTSAEDSGVNTTPTVILDGKLFTQDGSVDDLAVALLKAVS